MNNEFYISKYVRPFFEDYLDQISPVLFAQQNKDGYWTGYTSNYIPTIKN